MMSSEQLVPCVAHAIGKSRRSGITGMARGNELMRVQGLQLLGFSSLVGSKQLQRQGRSDPSPPPLPPTKSIAFEDYNDAPGTSVITDVGYSHCPRLG
jgi:hypothetical protein